MKRPQSPEVPGLFKKLKYCTHPKCHLEQRKVDQITKTNQYRPLLYPWPSIPWKPEWLFNHFSTAISPRWWQLLCLLACSPLIPAEMFYLLLVIIRSFFGADGALNFQCFRDAGPKCPIDNEPLSESQVCTWVPNILAWLVSWAVTIQ